MTQNTQISFELRDEFNRKKIAEKIIKLLRSDIQISPLVVDGSWGLGKTEFCQKLIKLMNEENTHHLIYIDAFKADHADEPLLTVLAKVLEVIPDEEEKKGLIQKAMPVLRYSLKTVAKAAASHILRQDTDSVLEGFDDEIKQISDKAIDASVESLLKVHVEAEKNLKALQEALKLVAAKKPIILFIDELDRCRPDFAVLMLETIKHTFDVEGVQFILVTNTDQLKASINHCYGKSIDAQRYLDKFLKFTFTLPSTINESRYEVVLTSVTHYKNCIERSTILNGFGLEGDAYLKLVEQIIITNNLSLREVETIVRYLEIYHSVSGDEPLSNNTFWAYKIIRIFGVLLVSIKPYLANLASLNLLDAQQLGEFIGVESLPNLDRRHPYPAHYETLIVMLGIECRYNKDLFTPIEPEKIALWNDYINQFFRGSHWPPEEGERLKILTETIKTIYLES